MPPPQCTSRKHIAPTHVPSVTHSLPSVGTVGLQGGDESLYTTTDPVENFTFTAPVTATYGVVFSTSGEYGFTDNLYVAIW